MTPDSKETNENFDSSLDQPDVVGETTMSAVSQPPVVLEPGEILLEKFRIIELIGRGGMGSVFRVEHLMVNRNYALKCLSKSQTTDGSWRRFQNEVKAAHMLDHPNLIRVFEFGLLPGGQPFFLMEIVDGPTLADEIKKLGSLDLDRALKIFIHVAFAIQYAHDHKVVHRDLKPSNIMLAKPHYAHEQEIVKVVDFGIAKLTGVDEFNQQTLTKTGEIFGSPLYMSPEQCMGIAVDHR
ncbi:MAG: serine/threonine protein kinase, partial [Cyanobacteria bacterium DS2.3.42]|nr:serine/threonine protein kinase [Cyanobacteria bacterium DS2.3.42]